MTAKYSVMGRLKGGESYDMEIEADDLKGAVDEYERMVGDEGREVSHIESVSLLDPIEA